MKKSRLIGALSAVVFTVISMSSHAALLGRDLDGDPTTTEAYYDPAANLTWLADANAAVGSAYDTWSPGTGRMNWADANAWAASLSINGVTGWRLPTTLQPDSSCDEQISGTSYGYNCTGSEMGNLFYTVLGNTAGLLISNTGPFINVRSSVYWSASEYALNTAGYTWVFNFTNGYQFSDYKDVNDYAWAVHSGDVGAPTLIGVLPATYCGADYQAYYDPAADLTWLANANANGLMNWDTANAWAAGLDVEGMTGWRLPTALNSDGSGPCGPSDCTGSEMGNLFYNVLGGVAGTSITTTHNSTYDLFSNVQSYGYWSSTEYALNTTGAAWYFSLNDGTQGNLFKTFNFYAWAVHDGDVRLIHDSDSDGLPNIVEDSNNNCIVDTGETNPLNPDTDNDGALDGQEDSNHNGVVDAGEADPLNPDSDGDGLTDGYEINVGGTDPSTATTLYLTPGDMNGDDEVNVGDLLLLQRQLMGL